MDLEAVVHVKVVKICPKTLAKSLYTVNELQHDKKKSVSDSNELYHTNSATFNRQPLPAL